MRLVRGRALGDWKLLVQVRAARKRSGRNNRVGWRNAASGGRNTNSRETAGLVRLEFVNLARDKCPLTASGPGLLLRIGSSGEGGVLNQSCRTLAFPISTRAVLPFSATRTTRSAEGDATEKCRDRNRRLQPHVRVRRGQDGCVRVHYCHISLHRPRGRLIPLQAQVDSRLVPRLQ